MPVPINQDKSFLYINPTFFSCVFSEVDQVCSRKRLFDRGIGILGCVIVPINGLLGIILMWSEINIRSATFNFDEMPPAALVIRSERIPSSWARKTGARITDHPSPS